MNIQCPHCGSSYDVEPSLIGQEVSCAQCNHSFTVSNPNLISCPSCYAQVSRLAASCPHCGAPLQPSGVVPQSSEGELSTEREVLTCRPSGLNYLLPCILGIITIPLIIGVVILLWCYINWRCTVYKITSLRVIVTTGLLAKFQNEIWIKDMRGVNLVQGPLQRLFGLGNVNIGTAATAGTEISLQGIKHPNDVIKTINSLR